MFPTEPVPERIGAYKVIRRLAGSGSADMYLGRMDGPMGFHRVCALKLVPNALEGDDRLAEALAREASICARLNHAAVVRMFDFFEHDRRLVLVLEHVDGSDLDRLLQHLVRRKQKLGDDAIWYLAHQLVGALAHGHAATDENGDAAPVIHRNIQPENVLISWDGQVRLTGFGLGKILGRTPDTVVGATAKGTPGYMAPEQVRGERVTPRADVYGWGALLWALLTGRRPPTDGTRLEAVSGIRKDIPREIAFAIEAALEPAVEKRKITCSEIQHWLEKVTNVEAGRDELREKVLLLRGTRSPVGVAEQTATAAPPPARSPRRRMSLRQVKASQRPAGPGPLSVPPPPSSRSLRAGASESVAPPSEGPRSRRALAAPRVPAIPREEPLDVDESPPSRRPATSQRTYALGREPSPPPPEVARQGTPSGSPASVRAPEAAEARPAFSAASAADVPPPALDGAWRDIGEEPSGAAVVVEGRSATATPLAETPAVPPRPLSTGQSIGVAALTAAVVVSIGWLVVDREPRPAPTANASGPAVGGPATNPVRPAPTPTVAASAPTVPATGAPPATQAPPPAASGSYSAGFGRLTIQFPGQATVFVNGTPAGNTNQPLDVVCGHWFVRVGEADANGRPLSWLTKGNTVPVPCLRDTTVELKPSPESGPLPRRR